MIRQFVKGIDEDLWASFLGINLEEFRRSMPDPEFKEGGMLIAEINGQVVDVVNAHISPSYPKFCVLRDFKIIERPLALQNSRFLCRRKNLTPAKIP